MLRRAESKGIINIELSNYWIINRRIIDTNNEGYNIVQIVKPLVWYHLVLGTAKKCTNLYLIVIIDIIYMSTETHSVLARQFVLDHFQRRVDEG